MAQDYFYISTDPLENADNFDPNWSTFRDMKTDHERCEAIRKKWGNPNIPDPKINLTYRAPINELVIEGKENLNAVVNQPNEFLAPQPVSRKKQKVSRRRSRSCTRAYEQQISNLEKNFEYEYGYLVNKLNNELHQLQQYQFLQTNSCNRYLDYYTMEYLEMQQKQVLYHLLKDHYNQVQTVLGRKNESIDTYKRYLEEVKAFFTFYQKMNADEITMQMTDSQYEHSTETEKMYALYKKFYA